MPERGVQRGCLDEGMEAPRGLEDLARSDLVSMDWRMPRRRRRHNPQMRRPEERWLNGRWIKG